MSLLPFRNRVTHLRHVERSIGRLHSPRKRSRASAVMARLKSTSVIPGPARSSILRSSSLPLATASANNVTCWELAEYSIRERSFAIFGRDSALEDVFTTYCNVLPPGTEAGKFKVISHVEQLARSTCARKSNGQLWCGTCHDPHNKPLEPVQFYRSKCLSCHMENFPGSHPDKESNCIGCHMPRRDAKDGGHTAFTDHRIQRRPEPNKLCLADTDIAAWREPAPDLQKRNLGIAYVNVGVERRSPPFVVRGYRMLTEVQDQFSTDSEVFTVHGYRSAPGQSKHRRRNWLSSAPCNSIQTRSPARRMPRQRTCKLEMSIERWLTWSAQSRLIRCICLQICR